MADERRVAAGDVDPQSFGPMQLGDRRHGPHADADALVIGQRHDPREAAVVSSGDHRQRRAKIHRDAVPGREVTRAPTASEPLK